MEVVPRKPRPAEKPYVEFPVAEYPDLANKVTRFEELRVQIGELDRKKSALQNEFAALLGEQPTGTEIRCAGARIGYDLVPSVAYKALIEAKRPSLLEQHGADFTTVSPRLYVRR